MGIVIRARNIIRVRLWRIINSESSYRICSKHNIIFGKFRQVTKII